MGGFMILHWLLYDEFSFCYRNLVSIYIVKKKNNKRESLAHVEAMGYVYLSEFLESTKGFSKLL